MKRRITRYICVLLTFMIVFSMAGNVVADQINDLKKKTEEDKKKLEEIDEQLSDLESEQQGLQGEISELEAQIIDMMTSISILEDEITVKQEEITQAESDLEVAIQDEQNQYEAMKLRIQFMYEHGDSSYLDILVNATSMQDVLNKADYIEQLYVYDRNLLTQYQETRATVEQLKETLEIEHSELEAIMAGYEEEKLGMEETMSELEAVSAEYDSQITKAKQQALVYKQQIKQQNAKIAKLEEEARKKAEEEARKKAEASKTNNTNNTTVKANGTAAVDKQSILAANGSAQGKEIAIYACGFVGNPYVLGGTSLTSGADCSGFTQAVYKAFGYKIPRTSYQQRSVGKEVSYAEAQPGDLICYAGHVAMYIGNGRIVHASSAKTGIKYGYATYREILAVRRIV
ncbi:MAG: NlpC/P60 family protein [Lachnospiraceae bacterium]|nr:NlpC/P60 family protein [Lachnospiraceae bacterium]